MDLTMISIKQIRYALAVEEHLHFKKAAEACAISQSALSNAINEMEKQLGIQVFERDNKKVLVTPYGERVLKEAREVFLRVSDLSKLGERLSSPLSTELSIGIIPTIAPFLLPRVLPKIQKEYPNLELSVIEDQSHELVDQVLKGTLDTAILALPYDTQGLLTFSFWEEDFYCVVNEDDPVSTLGSIGADDLDRDRLMLLKDGHCLKDHALSACKLSEETAFRLGGTSLMTLIELVAGNLGVTFVPEIAVRQLVTPHRDLKAIPLVEPGPHREFAFIVRPNYPSIGNIEVLQKLMRDELLANKTFG